MYIIRYLKTNQYFCYKHDKIIVFKDVEEANVFIQLFFQYSMTRAMQEEPELIFQIMEMMNSINIEEKPQDITEIITFDTIKKERQR